MSKPETTLADRIIKLESRITALEKKSKK